MKYATGAAFRQALGDQIRRLNLESDLTIDRIRKMVALDRFLDRLLQMYPDRWVVKGGFALQLRIGNQARTTKDIDLLLREEKMDIHVWSLLGLNKLIRGKSKEHKHSGLSPWLKGAVSLVM